MLFSHSHVKLPYARQRKSIRFYGLHFAGRMVLETLKLIKFSPKRDSKANCALSKIEPTFLFASSFFFLVEAKYFCAESVIFDYFQPAFLTGVSHHDDWHRIK